MKKPAKTLAQKKNDMTNDELIHSLDNRITKLEDEVRILKTTLARILKKV